MDLKHSVILLFIILAVRLPLQADEWDYYFQSGNELYQNGAYAKAIEAYQKILDYGYESGELYFNLGNANYKLNNLGKARLFYEKAQLFLKNDEALKQNLTMVELRLVDQIQPPPRLFLSVWWGNLIDLFSVRMLTVLALVFFWLMLIVGGLRLYLIRRGRKDYFRIVFMVILLIFLFFSVVLVQKIYIFETEQYGVILTDKVTLHAEPAQSSTELFILHEGSKVRIERIAGDWYEVRLLDGKTGWLQASALAII